MKYWLITDTHFGHVAMHTYCGRPHNFESKLILSVLRNVKEEDILVHLGDICIGNDDYWNRALKENCKGKMWLIRGNHDSKSTAWYMQRGWDFVGDFLIIKHFGKRIAFSHEPTIDAYLVDCYDINIHGHLHNTNHRSAGITEEINKAYKLKLLAVENTGYQVVNLENFL